MKDLPKCPCGGYPTLNSSEAGYRHICSLCGYSTVEKEDAFKCRDEWIDHCHKKTGDFITASPLVKPTIGPMPKFIWLERRVRELAEYLAREYSCDKPNHNKAWKHASDLYNMVIELRDMPKN